MAFKITNIKLKTSRLQAIVAVKTYFNLQDVPVTESVAKLDALLRDGLTVEYMVELDKFEDLNAFTYDLQETLSSYEQWEKEKDAKLELACQWYNSLPPEHQEFVNTLRSQMVPRA